MPWSSLSVSAQARHRAAHDALLAAHRTLIVGAGPSGLELAGEIKAFFPDKHVTIADISDDILVGPYDQALRDELRRQLDDEHDRTDQSECKGQRAPDVAMEETGVSRSLGKEGKCE